MNTKTRNYASVVLAFLVLLCLAPAPFGGGSSVNYGTPPPTVSVVGGIGTAGGTAPVSGANFVGSVSNPPTALLYLSGYPGPTTPLSVTWNSSISLDLTLAAGVYSAGIYPFQIIDTDGQSKVFTGLFQIGSELTPSVIFGINLVARWKCSQATCSGTCTTGSAIVTVPDQSGTGNDLNLVSTPAPTIQLNDTHFGAPNVTTCVHVRASVEYLERASMAITASPAALYVFAAAVVTSNGTVDPVWSFNTSNLLMQANATDNWQFLSGPSALATPPVPFNNPAILMGGNNGTTSTSSVNNAIFASGALSNTIQNSKNFYVAYKTTGPVASDLIWPEIDVVNVVPTALQATEMAAYYNATYQVTPLPGYLYNTGMAASTASAPLRIENSVGFTNYYSTTSVALTSGATSYACTNTGLVGSSGINSMDQTCVSTPAGTYNLAITNPDHSSPTTYANAITVTSATTPWTNFGFTTLAWYSGANVTCSSSPCVSGSSGITSYFDQAAMGHTPLQSTFADEPIWQSGLADSTFNNKPYGVPNGTSDQLTFGINPIVNDGSSTAFVAFGVINQGASGVTAGTFFEPINNANQFRCNLASKVPQTQSGASVATYGSAVSGTQNIECDIPSGANPTIYVNSANSGSPVTTATALSANVFNATQHLFVHSANGAQYSNVPMAEEVFVNTVPSGGQRTTRESYTQSYYNAQ